jgi:hypothetical protein
MSNTRNPHGTDALKPSATRNLALATTALSVVIFASPALAVDYSYGEVSGSIDTFVSAGASMRTSARDCRNLGAPSGGCKIRDAGGVELGGGVNSDDGNLNYGQWDVFSGALKATSEVGATWRNFNAFVRGSAFVDPIVDNTDFRDLDASARSEVSQNAKLLDYFVGGSFDVGGLPLELRGGNQVISWGESTFIQNGINVINPVDVSATRKPGSEVKEFFTPILAAKAALGLPMNFSLEGFYQFKADNIVPDPSGTFFSGADIIGRGSQPAFSSVGDIGDDARFNPFETSNGLNTNVFWNSRLGVNGPSVIVERANDVNADDGGEFGLALRYFAEELNNGTEFGLYFINYHSRLPIATSSIMSTTKGYSYSSGTNASPQSRAANKLVNTNGVSLPTSTDLLGGPGTGSLPNNVPANVFELGQQLCNALAPLGATLAAQGVGSAVVGQSLASPGTAKVNFATPGGFTNCNNLLQLRTGAADIERNVTAVIATGTNFRLEYPEDIKLVGASMSTTLGSIALQAEATYRHDQPMSFVSSEVTALSFDLTGMTAMMTGAALPAGVGAPNAPGFAAIEPSRFYIIRTQATNQAAAGASAAAPGDLLYNFADVARLQQGQTRIVNGVEVDIVPGTVATPGLTPTAGLGLAADRAAAGTLTVADLPGAFFASGVNTGLPGQVLAGTGGNISGPAGGIGQLLGLGGSTQTLTPLGANPPGTSTITFPAGTAGSLVEVANRVGFIVVDVENITPAGAAALSGGSAATAAALLAGFGPGQSLASNVPNGRAADVLFARHPDSVRPGVAIDGAGDTLAPLIPQTRSSALTAADVRPDGFVRIPREDVFTAQATATMALFGSNPVVQMMAADGGGLVTEVGMVMVPGISTNSAIASSGSEGLVNPIANQTFKLNSQLKGPTNYATPFSWGAQGVVNMTYNRVFGSPVNLVPQIAWRWDIGGRTPSPLGNYMAERKAIGLSLGANYQSRWTGSVSWTANFGPDAPLDDRDFASINIAYAF